MKKNSKQYFGISITGLLIVVLVFSCGIDVEKRTLADYITQHRGKIKIYYVDPGATGKEVIQVASSKSGTMERIVTNFEKNYLKNSVLINDSVLELTLSDSGSHVVDTVKVSLPRYP